MKQLPDQNPTQVEDDAVWHLLDRASTRRPGPRFVDDVVRLSRLDGNSPQPWWSRWFAPVPLASVAGLAAAAIFGLFLFHAGQPGVVPGQSPVVSSQRSTDEEFAHVQEVLETEMLFAAVERLDETSDEELLALIGF